MRPLMGKFRHYDWGSRDTIPRILGLEPTGEPVAEYWLGAHPSSPSTLDDLCLDELITNDPSVVGDNARTHFEGRLSFLIKLLSAARPLSLQAHPTLPQAQAGYDAENVAGIALDAPDRTYRDPWDKPELLIAVTPFDALVGFRDPAHSIELFEALGVSSATLSLLDALRLRSGSAAMAELFLNLLVPDEQRQDALVEVVSAAVTHVDDEGEVGLFARTAVELDEHFPNDTSLLAALLLNRVHLEPGEAVHLEPGTMHAYLSGTGVEVLGNSDNVLRGGLTSKYIDAPGLVQVVDFTAVEMHPMSPVPRGDGLWYYPAEEAAFAAWRLDLMPGREVTCPAYTSARILLVTEGGLTLADGTGHLTLARGQAAWLAAGEQVKITGEGTGFLAATGLDA